MTIDPTKVSFSEAQGLRPLPRQLEAEELNDEARIDFWNAFYVADTQWHSIWRTIVRRAHARYFRQPLDEFVDHTQHIHTRYKTYILNWPYHEVFDLLLFFLRHPNCPATFKEEVKFAFESNRLAYVLDATYPPTIYPATTPEEGQAIVGAVNQLQESGLDGARQHLTDSATFLNQGHWANSIKESISAVESVARVIAPGTRNLGSALNQLGHLGMLEHPSLRNGLEKLYEYTNEEGGIRHARLNEDASNVGQDEAVFMLGACASFASYLWRKHLGAT